MTFTSMCASRSASRPWRSHARRSRPQPEGAPSYTARRGDHRPPRRRSRCCLPGSAGASATVAASVSRASRPPRNAITSGSRQRRRVTKWHRQRRDEHRRPNHDAGHPSPPRASAARCAANGAPKAPASKVGRKRRRSMRGSTSGGSIQGAQDRIIALASGLLGLHWHQGC